MHNHCDFSIEKYNRLKKMGFDPKTTLDIGAHKGDWSVLFKNIFPNTEIFCVEGQPNSETYLKEKNLNYLIKLLGNEVGHKTFFVKTQDICCGASIYKETTQWYQKCDELKLPIDKLDNINVEKKIYDYIKIDVQGAELDIIKGGLKTILDCSFLQLELSVLQFNQNAPLASEVISYLYNLDFYIYDICSHFYWNNRLNQFDVIFINRRKNLDYLKI